MLDTPYTDINRLLESLLSHIRRSFQERLVGLYLYGSLTTGDFDPDISDIDLLAVISSQITALEIDALRAMHRNFALDNPAWEDRVDVVYLPIMSLKEFRTEESLIVISPGEPFHIREGEALRDWLQNWYIVRESGLALFGPAPKLIIPHITKDEFVDAVRRYVTEVSDRVRHERDKKSQAYTILTLCRALYMHRTGKQASKRQAALWAQQEFPEWSSLIQDALEWRQAWCEGHINHPNAKTNQFVKFMSDQILAV